ncbi:winged helix-turn-helix domain-containing protein [uncultured Paraglaciecola sp.]|uniref:winged helix-turn-helix domain-containing protein n=1 Tax=uncultured Paraglaciecola sp. TaxID=1765024 RepID=UPI0030DB7B67|tara:strand:- start:3742 stop:4620 length:879 start_codon:yes stop_codon:yes gene_type:complete
MIYQFPCFEINSLNKQLYINGKSIAADERLVDLLIELAQHYPKHCSKSSLLKTIWPNTVVSEWSISKLVSEARHLFKQHGYNKDVIQTLHGRGYRLANNLGEQIRKIDGQVVPTELTKPKTVTFMVPKIHIWLPIAAVILVSAIVFYFVNSSTHTFKKSEPEHSVGRLLWVDDHPDNNIVEKTYFENHNITVYQVTSSEAALTSLSLYQYTVIISDMGRNGEVLAGLNLLKALRERDNHTPFIMYTIVLTQAQQSLLEKYQGQGVAVEPDKLYQLVLPYFHSINKTSPDSEK